MPPPQLRPPRRVRLGDVIALEDRPRGGPAAGMAPPLGIAGTASRPLPGEPHHAPLTGPVEARPVLRRLFDPAAGWFRRLERVSSLWLSRELYPSIPGLTAFYSGIVDRQLTVCEGEVALSGLPEAFAGVRVLLVSDLHVGPFFSARALQRTFDRLLLLHPDLILIAGDLTTSRVEEFAPCTEVFRSFRAPLGTFAVMGNHDHYSGRVERLRAMVEAAGVPVLHNRAVVLERDGARLSLAGIDDLIEGTPDLDAALASIPADVRDSGAPVLLMSHNPDIFFQAERHGVSLVLAGHTHGGQVRVPGLPVIVRQSRYRLDEGRYRFGESQIVVSRGLGVTGIPIRVACAPEAVLLTLQRA